MANITALVYRNEAGDNNNPAVNGVTTTHCGSSVIEKKIIKEVLISWDAINSEWVEDEAFVSGQSIVALKVENPCDGTFSYIDYPYQDFRLEQLCCPPPACASSVVNWEVLNTDGIDYTVQVSVNGNLVVNYFGQAGDSGSFNVNQGDEVEFTVDGEAASFFFESQELGGLDSPFTVTTCNDIFTFLVSYSPE